MINIICALHCEAAPLIKKFNLKKKTSCSSFNIYTNDTDINLIISGVGAIASASAASHLLAITGCSRDDFLINIGSACQLLGDSSCDCFLINKLTDQASNRTFFPDMLYNADSQFIEAEIISGMKVLTPGEVKNYQNSESGSTVESLEAKTTTSPAQNAQPAPLPLLYDMEAAFIFQAAQYYLGPAQISFIKIISDTGIDSTTTSFSDLSKQIEAQIEARLDLICAYFSKLLAQQDNSTTDKLTLSDSIISDFHASKTMENELLSLYRYAALSDFDFQKQIAIFYENGDLPVADKKSGVALIKKLTQLIIAQ